MSTVMEPIEIEVEKRNPFAWVATANHPADGWVSFLAGSESAAIGAVCRRFGFDGYEEVVAIDYSQPIYWWCKLCRRQVGKVVNVGHGGDFYPKHGQATIPVFAVIPEGQRPQTTYGARR